MTTRVFVYGTLKRGFSANYMLGQNAKLLGTTSIPGVMVSIGHFPGLVEDSLCQVKGEVYEIEASQLPRLDNYEGVARGMYARRSINGAFGDMYYYEYLCDLPLPDHKIVAKEGEWRSTTYYPMVSGTWTFKEEKEHWAKVRGETIAKMELPEPEAPTCGVANGVRAAIERQYGLTPVGIPNPNAGSACPIPEPKEVPLTLPKVGSF